MTKPPSAKRPRAAIDRASIVAAAVRIADEEDLEALTMRRLARELAVGTMTLYGYFANKDEILDAMADSIMGSYMLPPRAAHDDAREVFIAATSTFTVLLVEHPSVARLLTMRVTDSPVALDGSMEKILHEFLDAGMSEETAVTAYGVMMHYALGSALYRIPRPWGDPSDQTARSRSSRVWFYRSLDAERFPRLHELAHLLPNLPGQKQFVAGLEAIADGLGLSPRATDVPDPDTGTAPRQVSTANRQ